MNFRSLISISFIAINFGVNAHPVPFKRNIQLEEAIVSNYADMAYSNYLDNVLGAKELGRKLKTFTSNPTQQTMAEAKNTWTTSARIPYGQSEIFRFVNGPIDFEPINDGITTYLESINYTGVEGLLNAWPLDEAYIDYVDGDQNAGIINDINTPITKEELVILNERDGEKNVSTGYHAIEFLLWGQDKDLQGPGNRPVTDYTTEKNAERRKLYLNTLSEVMEEHLQKVLNQWVPNETNFRKEFMTMDPRTVLTQIFTSMISMAGDELKSERIENALLLEDQEEEHSCFSDTTVNDIFANFLGVKNLYVGSYKAFNGGVLSVQGASVSDLLAEINPTLDKEIRNAIFNVEAAIAPFYGVAPQSMELGKNSIALAFDVAITSEQDKVQNIVDRLNELEGLLKQAALELGLSL